MTAALLVLCLAAFAIVSGVGSLMVAAACSLLDRAATQLSPAQRTRLWFGAACAPGLLAALSLVVSFLPAVGLGTDHCLTHDPHHPHLCPNHLGGPPGTALVVAAVLLVARIAHAALQLARDARLSLTTSRALGQASDTHDEAWIFDSDVPQAFVLGTVRPRVHVSRGLLSLGARVADPVLAHERAHVRRRDPLFRAACTLVCVAHLPVVGTALRKRLLAAQEMSADEAAADALNDRPAVASALLAIARSASIPPPALSMTHGDLDARVRALLDSRPVANRALPRIAGLASLTGIATLASARHWIHHTLETLLGALS